MFKNKQLINSDSDQSLTATTTTFKTFEANEPTNNFGQSGKGVKQVRQTRQTGRPLFSYTNVAGGTGQNYGKHKRLNSIWRHSASESTGGHPPANKLSNANDNANHSLH